MPSILDKALSQAVAIWNCCAEHSSYKRGAVRPRAPELSCRDHEEPRKSQQHLPVNLTCPATLILGTREREAPSPHHLLRDHLQRRKRHAVSADAQCVNTVVGGERKFPELARNAGQQSR